MKYVTLLIFFIISICTTAPLYAQKERAKTVSVKKFDRKRQHPNVVVLDVRTDAEFVEGHIENAVWIDVNKADFAQQIQTLDKQKTYLVYCRSGKRSEKALHILQSAGFEKAYHLKGGYLQWQKEKQD